MKFDRREDGRNVYSMSLLAGKSCPWAKACYAEAVEQPDGKRKVVDGPDTEFRCFSASQEAMYKATYDARKRNLELIKASLGSISAMADLIEGSLRHKATKKDLAKGLMVRAHVSGDMFHFRYLLAWVEVARRNPDWVVYGYTKAVRLTIRIMRWGSHVVPKNFSLTLSYGGKDDHLIEESGMKYSKVVHSEEEAEALGLPIDVDDSLASDPDHGPFALLIHGSQPKGSDAAKALVQIKKRKKANQ